MKKKWLIFICLGIVVISLLLTGLFYSIPYIKLNEWVNFVNKKSIENTVQDSEWVSGEDFTKLRIVETVNEDEFLHLRMKNKVKINSFNKMVIKSDITAYTTLKGTNQKINNYKATKEIHFEFKNNKWMVTDVS